MPSWLLKSLDEAIIHRRRALNTRIKCFAASFLRRLLHSITLVAGRGALLCSYRCTYECCGSVYTRKCAMVPTAEVPTSKLKNL